MPFLWALARHRSTLRLVHSPPGTPIRTTYCVVRSLCFRAFRAYNAVWRTCFFLLADMEDVYLSLGSNLGDRAQNLRRALVRLATVGRVSAISSLYESEPVDYTEQPWFLNAVVKLEVKATAEGDEAAPQQLLSALHSIEHELGRRREGAIVKGPRTLDLDILLYGRRVLRTPELVVPHAAMHERRFVLEPLAEIAPGVLHPVLQQSARALLAALPPGQQLRRIGTLDAADER